MTYNLDIDYEAAEQLAFLRKGDKNAYLKCFDFILSMLEDPRSGIGKPERLKGYGDREVYSRRINDKDRLVYAIHEEQKILEIISCLGHYGDK